TLGEMRHAARRRAGNRGLGERDHQRVAFERGLVAHRTAQVEHQPRAVGTLYHVHAAQVALADVLVRAPERVGGVRKVEGDARATEKFGGTLFSGSLVVTRTTVLPPSWLTSKVSIVFCADACAANSAKPARPRSQAEVRLMVRGVALVF